MNDAGKEMMLDALKQLLNDPAAFKREYKQPMGEQWKHVLWHFAEAVVKVHEETAKTELEAYKAQHKIKEFDDLVLFCWQNLAVHLNDIADELDDAEGRVTLLEKEVDHLRSTLRAVEQTLDLQTQRLAHLDGSITNGG